MGNIKTSRKNNSVGRWLSESKCLQHKPEDLISDPWSTAGKPHVIVCIYNPNKEQRREKPRFQKASKPGIPSEVGKKREILPQNWGGRDTKTTQWVAIIINKHQDLSLIPGTLLVEGEHWLLIRVEVLSTFPGSYIHCSLSYRASWQKIGLSYYCHCSYSLTVLPSSVSQLLHLESIPCYYGHMVPVTWRWGKCRWIDKKGHRTGYV